MPLLCGTVALRAIWEFVDHFLDRGHRVTARVGPDVHLAPAVIGREIRAQKQAARIFLSNEGPDLAGSVRRGDIRRYLAARGIGLFVPLHHTLERGRHFFTLGRVVAGFISHLLGGCLGAGGEAQGSGQSKQQIFLLHKAVMRNVALPAPTASEVLSDSNFARETAVAKAEKRDGRPAGPLRSSSYE